MFAKRSKKQRFLMSLLININNSEGELEFYYLG